MTQGETDKNTQWVFAKICQERTCYLSLTSLVHYAILRKKKKKRHDASFTHFDIKLCSVISKWYRWYLFITDHIRLSCRFYFKESVIKDSLTPEEEHLETRDPLTPRNLGGVPSPNNIGTGVQKENDLSNHRKGSERTRPSHPNL